MDPDAGPGPGAGALALVAQKPKAAGAKGSSHLEAVPEPAYVSEFTGSEKSLVAELKEMREELRSLQGGLFSLSSRMEEVVTDSHAEKYNSRMQELAVYRQKFENDSSVATRIGQCEFAVLQASGAIRQLEDQTRQLSQNLYTAVHGLQGAPKAANDCREQRRRARRRQRSCRGATA
eukprot:SRR837773.11771.p1 GENE.SRR837773.11771~~SRR837773.11771.p1  ORF type:complete len:187 (-),score=58.33 SRR837773.11771:158-688(-)